MGSPLTIGIVGVGKISEQYFAALPSLPNLKLIAVADLNEARAAEVAAEQGVESMSVDALLADDRIEAILNLTIPAAQHVRRLPRTIVGQVRGRGECKDDRGKARPGTKKPRQRQQSQAVGKRPDESTGGPKVIAEAERSVGKVV